MSLKLYYHPLSSFCQKALVALYENDTPFTPVFIDLGNEASKAQLLKIWPIGKFPVLEDLSRNRVVPESSIIIEYLAQYYPGRSTLVPADPDLARENRARDRFFDLDIQVPMQKIVSDRWRPADKKDPFGVERAQASLRVALDLLEGEMTGKTWAMGEEFSMADCAAAPALYYANFLEPFTDRHAKVASYFARLLARPSFARAVKEAEPYRHLLPQ
ncbi:MAG TPA: glutathione S-transferase family protein [Dongiaceae bacterium]|jgi:glutathione S-transferase|nr:glutathione S-transferase family protein [Dongiaceae bacterium]